MKRSIINMGILLILVAATAAMAQLHEAEQRDVNQAVPIAAGDTDLTAKPDVDKAKEAAPLDEKDERSVNPANGNEPGYDLAAAEAFRESNKDFCNHCWYSKKGVCTPRFEGRRLDATGN